jgi:4-hydroxy-3-methylbut-2-enyl diphosphate reductase
VIVGDRDHAEVIGLMGYCETPVHVVQDPKDVQNLPDMDRVVVVAQTTQNAEWFDAVVARIRDRFPEVLVFNTICEATHHRQEEVKRLAQEVNGMVVVGGYHSGNTRRLVDVSRETGIPTFHVETERDLDKKQLSRMEQIGVTAGASTPNWMIKNVVREIESIRGRGESPMARWLNEAWRFLVLSNILAGAGALSFAYAAGVLSQRDPGFTFPLVAFLYIFAMHVLNRFLDRGASAYNDPERAAFLSTHRPILIGAAVGSIVASFALSLRIGWVTFLVLIALTGAGILYSVPLLPDGWQRRHSYSKIKDIPGSRSLSEALAWTVVITILPLLQGVPGVWPAAAVAILFVFSMSYTRSVLFDIFQVQGDLVVGTETLPILFGEAKSLTLLKLILLGGSILLLSGPLLGLVDAFSYVMLIPLLTLSSCLLAYQKGWLFPGMLLESLVEVNFLLSGFLALFWTWV